MEPHLSNMHSRLRRALWGEKWFDISLYMLFFAIFLSPFINSILIRMFILSIIFSMLMIAGVMSITGHTALRIAAGMTACVAIALRWVQFAIPTPGVVKLASLSVLIFLIMLNAVTLTKVFSKGRVTTHKIKGAIACYMLFGLTWSLLYGFLDQVLPNAFNLPSSEGIFTPERQEILTYYSFATLTTVGYGDVLPVHDIARMFAVMEGLCGQLYPATLLARLVSLELMTHNDA